MVVIYYIQICRCVNILEAMIEIIVQLSSACWTTCVLLKHTRHLLLERLTCTLLALKLRNITKLYLLECLIFKRYISMLQIRRSIIAPNSHIKIIILLTQLTIFQFLLWGNLVWLIEISWYNMDYTWKLIRRTSILRERIYIYTLLRTFIR